MGMMEGKTLDKLNVQVGDVVECVGWTRDDSTYCVGNKYTIMERHPAGYVNEMCAVRENDGYAKILKDYGGDQQLFRIVSRANDPKLWRDMTAEEKGALLLAAHEGQVIQFYNPTSDWWYDLPKEPFQDAWAYRVKPEPQVENVELLGITINNFGWRFDQGGSCADTHRITFSVVDGKPDCSSIKMEELTQ